MGVRCLDLDDEAATDVATAGAKAAGLARARRAGLPALPGVVVPVAESAATVDRAVAALDRGDARRARLAAIDIEPDSELLAELTDRLASYRPPLIVRSSSPLEGDGRWSGAFSTFHGLSPEDLRTAIRGCWGSAFSRGVLERSERFDTAYERLGLAILVQAELAPELGGVARADADGVVRITTSRGPLYPLMAGHVEGEQAVVGAGDSVEAAGTDHDRLREVALLARRVRERLGHDVIEWATTVEGLHLLQTRRSAESADRRAALNSADPMLATPTAQRIASVCQRFPGRLADELVLPWAVATAPPPALPDAPGEADPAMAFATARALANESTALVWGGSPRRAASEAERALRQLRSGDVGPALETLVALPRPTPETIARIMDALAIVRDALLSTGAVPEDAAFWRLPPAEVEDIVHGRGAAPPPARFGVDRWEPFVHAVVAAVGEPYWGTPAVPGAGAGRAHPAGGSGPTPSGRYVLVAPEPTPALGPLLWNAAGLVTRAGSTAAHLIEFANSIGVPTVVGCALPDIAAPDPPLVAIDGEQGRVTVANLAWK